MAQERYGQTPLHWASAGGYVDFFRVLLEHGADVTTQDWCGHTALHLASEGGEEAARILLEHGANVTTQNEGGLTALHMTLRMEDTAFSSSTART